MKMKSPGNGRITNDILPIADEDPAEALRTLAKDKERRAAAFGKEMTTLCDKWKCDLVARATIIGQEIRTDVLIVAK